MLKVYSAWGKCNADSTDDARALLSCTACAVCTPKSAPSVCPGLVVHCPRLTWQSCQADPWECPVTLVTHDTTAYWNYQKRNMSDTRPLKSFSDFSNPFLNRLHFQIPGTEDVHRLELHICKTQCVFLSSSMHFLRAPRTRENSQNHKITESFTLEKTPEIIKTNLWLTTTLPARQ